MATLHHRRIGRICLPRPTRSAPCLTRPRRPARISLTLRSGITICALHLCYRSKTLPTQTPEGVTTYTALALSSSESSHSNYCARRDHPAAYKEIMEASYAIERKMGDEFKFDLTPGNTQPIRLPPSWEEVDAPLLSSCLISSRMLLHSLNSDAFDRDSCIQHARDFAQLVKIWVKELQEVGDQPQKWSEGRFTSANSDNIANVTTRTRNGIGGPYILTGWFWAADRLLKGARVLNAMGRQEGNFERFNYVLHDPWLTLNSQTPRRYLKTQHWSSAR